MQCKPRDLCNWRNCRSVARTCSRQSRLARATAPATQRSGRRRRRRVPHKPGHCSRSTTLRLQHSLAAAAAPSNATALCCAIQVLFGTQYGAALRRSDDLLWPLPVATGAQDASNDSHAPTSHCNVWARSKLCSCCAYRRRQLAGVHSSHVA